MSPQPSVANAIRTYNLLFLANPRLWPQWPFLPVMRRRPGCEEEEGVIYDARGRCNKLGFACTVFLVNFFLRPPIEEAILQLPHETYDTPEELFAAGWTVE
jgi:hypothetical protein